jgi:hypothetical protein
MATNNLELIIEGRPEAGGYVLASDFITGIQAFMGTMNIADKLVTGAKSPSFLLRIVGLSLCSPARVLFAAEPKKDIDVRDDVSRHLFGVIDSIERGKEIALDDYALLENLQTLVSPIGKSVVSLGVTAKDNKVSLTEEFQHKVGLRIAAEETFPGHLTGMLEYINVHAGTRSFRIYPDIGPSHVTCDFPQEMTDLAVDGIRQYVGVWGNLRQKKAARYPYAIDVEHIEIFPPEDDLPKLRDLYGIAPAAIGSMTSEEFVWSARGTLE